MKLPEVAASDLLTSRAGMSVVRTHCGDLSRGLEDVPVLFEGFTFCAFQVTIL